VSTGDEQVARGSFGGGGRICPICRRVIMAQLIYVHAHKLATGNIQHGNELFINLSTSEQRTSARGEIPP